MRFVRKPETSVILSDGFSRIRVVIADAALPNTSENTSFQFEVGNGKAILGPVFLADGEVRGFPAVACQIPKLTNICRRDKTS